VISATGWTWSDVDDLTWSQLVALLEYWEEFPPMHVCVQGIASGFLGRPIGRARTRSAGKPSASSGSTEIKTAEQLMDLVLGSGLGGVIVKPKQVPHG
jgi:hypothetical protein